MNRTTGYSTDLVIQYSIIGLILLAALGWILWKILRKDRNKDLGSCCGCTIADTCKKVQRKDHGNNKNIQREHS